jgi:hypothetical protein
MEGPSNMANIKTNSDGGPNPNTPTIEQMRESQRKGSEGQGTNTEDYADRMAIRNHGIGKGEGEDPSFPKTGEATPDYKLPWE